jgi:hypothetical protein
LLIDPAEGMTLFDMAAIAAAIKSLTHAKVDVKTPEDLSIKFRSRVVAEAWPVVGVAAHYEKSAEMTNRQRIDTR